MSEALTVAFSEIGTFSIDDNGVVWCHGKVKFPFSQNQHQPNIFRITYPDIRIISISVEDRHWVGIDTERRVWGMGSNYFFELGISSYFKDGPTKIENPTLLAVPEPVISVTCGIGRTLFVTPNNTVYGCGSNYFHQLGFPKGLLFSNRFIKKPTLIKNLKNIVSVSCRGCSTFFLENNGDVFVCGYAYTGDLGLGINHLPIESPKKHPTLKNVKKICNSTCYTLILSSNEVFIFGKEKYSKPTLIPMATSSPIIELFAGPSDAIILEENSTLWRIKVDVSLKPTRMVSPKGNITSISIANDKMIAITSEGVYAHGNTRNRDIPFPFNQTLREWTKIPEDEQKYFEQPHCFNKNAKSAKKI